MIIMMMFMMILIRMSIIDEADLFKYDGHSIKCGSRTHQLTIFCFKFVSKNTERAGCLRPLRLVKIKDMIYL